MRVLQIINSLGTAGAEKLVLDTVPLYNKKGIRVDVLVFHNNNYPFHQQLQDTNLCIVYNLNVHWVYSPLSIFKMMPILKNYDIAHVHLFPAQYYVVLAKLLSFTKIKLIFTEHNTTNRRLENPIFKFIDRWIYRFYDKIVAISPEIKMIIQTHTGLPNTRFDVIENGVAVNQIIEALPIDKNFIDAKIKATDFLIVMIAGFRPQKDQETLIKSISLLPDTIKLVLAGEGTTKNRCMDLVTELQLEERVFFIGIRSDIPNLLQTADIIVLSSHYEGMSLSSIEGMAAGKPFVASAVPGLQEVVAGHGVLFKRGNAEELANIIKMLLEDSEYYKKVANACVLRALQFDIKKMVEKHVSLYNSIKQ